MTKRLARAHPIKFQHCLSYTTRPPLPTEQNGQDYYFTSDDELMTNFGNGELLQIYLSKGHKYAFKLESIDEISQQGKICVLNMDLQVGTPSLFVNGQGLHSHSPPCVT